MSEINKFFNRRKSGKVVPACKKQAICGWKDAGIKLDKAKQFEQNNRPHEVH